MPAVRVDAGDSRPVSFTVTAAEGATLAGAEAVVHLVDMRPGTVAELLEAEVVFAEDGSVMTVSTAVSWPASTLSGLFAVDLSITHDGEPVESAQRWFYVIGARG